MFPSWCSPPSRIQKSSCRHQTLKHTGWKWVWLWCETTTGFLFLTALLRHRLTFPQMLCTAVSQNGDECLFISAKLLLSCLEEDLRAQKSGAMMDLWWQRNFRIWHHSPYISSLDSVCAGEEWAEQIHPFQSLTQLCSHITYQGDSNIVTWTSSKQNHVQEDVLVEYSSLWQSGLQGNSWPTTAFS